MKKISLILVFVLHFLYGDIISQQCKNKWKTDYSMIKYCIDQQTTARSIVVSYSNDEVKKMCNQKWKSDYSMVRYCIDQQHAARRFVISYPDDEIKRMCSRKWGTDYTMVKYCINQQSKAKRTLGMQPYPTLVPPWERWNEEKLLPASG